MASKKKLVKIAAETGTGINILKEELDEVNKKISQLENRTSKILFSKNETKEKLNIFEKKLQTEQFPEEDPKILKLLLTKAKTFHEKTNKKLENLEIELKEKIPRLVELGKLRSILESEITTRQESYNSMMDEIKDLHILEKGTEKQKEMLLMKILEEDMMNINKAKKIKSKSLNKNSFENIPDSILAWSLKYHAELEKEDNSEKLKDSQKTLAKSRQKLNTPNNSSKKTSIKSSTSDIIKNYL